jgi:hypothetical protein
MGISLPVAAEIINVSNEKFHLFVSFNRLEAAPSPNNPDCPFHLLKRVSAHPPFVCGFRMVTRRRPPAQPEFEHPTASHQSSTPNTPAAVSQNIDTGKRIDGY